MQLTLFTTLYDDCRYTTLRKTTLNISLVYAVIVVFSTIYATCLAYGGGIPTPTSACRHGYMDAIGCPYCYGPVRVYTGPSPQEQALRTEQAQLLAKRSEMAEKKQKAEEADQNGLNAGNHGHWKEAAEWFIKALEFQPDSVEIRVHLDRANTALLNMENIAELVTIQDRIQNAFSIAKLEALQRKMENDWDTIRLSALLGATNHDGLESRTVLGTWSSIDQVKLFSSAIKRDNPQIAASMHRLYTMQVPPPILPEEAAIAFGEIAPDDLVSKGVILGGEAGVAVMRVLGKIGTVPFISTKMLLVTGNVFIAAENGADVYLVKQNGTYEKALIYLRNKVTCREFTAIVRAIKEHRPISENASIEMVRAAQAIIDPKLGNSSWRIAWDAMRTPEAIHSGLTRACIEMGSESIEFGTSKLFARLMTANEPAFHEATEFLPKARFALQHTNSGAARESLNEAIKLANQIIARSYHIVEPAAEEIGAVTSSIFKASEEERREKK